MRRYDANGGRSAYYCFDGPSGTGRSYCLGLLRGPKRRSQHNLCRFCILSFAVASTIVGLYWSTRTTTSMYAMLRLNVVSQQQGGRSDGLALIPDERRIETGFEGQTVTGRSSNKSHAPGDGSGVSLPLHLNDSQSGEANSLADENAHDADRHVPTDEDQLLNVIQTTHPTIHNSQVEKARNTPPTTVFYNIYIPGDLEDYTMNAIAIVKEQLQQLATSYAATRNDTKPLLVIYVTIGADVLNTSYMVSESMCPPSLECRHAGHHATGMEEVTLQLVHDFCQIPENRREGSEPRIVTYIHNKGSFNAFEYNTHWRRDLTNATVHQGCIEHVQAGDCNVCGLRFAYTWTPMVPGNMWTTTCQYVSKLLKVDDYARKLKEAVSKALLMRLRKKITMLSFADTSDRFGLGRYSNEHWIGSHPDVDACEVGKDEIWFKSPRAHLLAHPGPWPEDGFQEREIIYRDTINQQIDFYGLAGNILKWQTIYGRVPHDNSTLWSIFRQGSFWKNHTNTFGEKAVELVLTDIGRAQGLIPVDEDSPKILAIETHFNTTNRSSIASSIGPPYNNNATTSTPVGGHAVFFDLYHADKRTNDSLSSQLQQAWNDTVFLYGSNETQLYFVVSVERGTDFPDEEHLCRLGRILGGRHCQVLQRFEGHYVGETQRQLYNYCQMHPSDKVSYIHNRLVETQTAQLLQLFRKNELRTEEEMIQDLTRAALGAQCAEQLNRERYGYSRNESCNVCGWRFAAMPAMSMAGNMYSAECSYVNRLLEPTMYAAKMTEFVTEVLILKAEGKLSNAIFSESMYSLGLDQYSMLYWITSGPSIRPCDVYSKSATHQSEEVEGDDRNSSDTHIQPTRWFSSLIPVSDMDETAKEKFHKVLAHENVRMKEVSFLAGVLLKWLMLYGTTAPLSSWVYEVYPDGERWKLGMKAHGRTFLDSVLETYMQAAL